MSKSIELVDSQTKAIESGSTAFILPIGNDQFNIRFKALVNAKRYEDLIERYSPLQKGDKDVLVNPNQDQEEGFLTFDTVIEEILDVEAKRVENLTIDEMQCIFPVLRFTHTYNGSFEKGFIKLFDNQMQEQESKHLQETGETISLGRCADNIYVFLVKHIAVKGKG